MATMLHTVLAFIVAISLLVVIHEFGHYWVARRCGVRVLRFSVGFGPVLVSRKLGAQQTEWALCAIPLGGYVKMLDEREGPVPESELEKAFNRKSLAKRSLIVAAGPTANLLLAVVLYGFLYVTGMQDLRPVFGTAPEGSVAASAGVRDGDLAVAVDGKAVQGWEDMRWMMLGAVVDGETHTLQVKSLDGRAKDLSFDLSGVDIDDLGTDPLRKLGFVLQTPRLDPVVGQVVAGMPAFRSGIQVGDRFVAVDGEAVESWKTFATIVANAPGKPLRITLERRGRMLDVTLVPDTVESNGKRIGKAGVAVQDAPDVRETMFLTVAYPPLEAGVRACWQVWDTSFFTLRMLGKMVLGELSIKNISGPITIAEYAGQSAQLGLDYFVKFLALISISIGVLNLLPIPVLDGGHLMYYLAEFLYRKPLPEQVFEYGQRFGLAILMLMMGIALFNDLHRQFFG